MQVCALLTCKGFRFYAMKVLLWTFCYYLSKCKFSAALIWVRSLCKIKHGFPTLLCCFCNKEFLITDRLILCSSNSKEGYAYSQLLANQKALLRTQSVTRLAITKGYFAALPQFSLITNLFDNDSVIEGRHNLPPKH